MLSRLKRRQYQGMWLHTQGDIIEHTRQSLAIPGTLDRTPKALSRMKAEKLKYKLILLIMIKADR